MGNDLDAVGDMLLHDLILLGRQPSGFVQQAIGESGFAHVEQQRAGAKADEASEVMKQ